MDDADRRALIDKVTERTQGTQEHPLTRATVQKVVDATLEQLGIGTLPDQPDQPADDADDTAHVDDPADGAD